MTDLHGERIARMETELQYIKRDIDELKGDVSDINAKQDQLLDILTQAKGVRAFFRVSWPGFVWVVALVVSYWSSIKTFFIKIGG